MFYLIIDRPILKCSLSFSFATILDVYHLNITIVNSCNSNVTVSTNHTFLTYQKFVILVDERYHIKSVSSKDQRIFIRAYNQTTEAALTIDGQDEIFVSYSINQYSYLYYVASGEFV